MCMNIVYEILHARLLIISFLYTPQRIPDRAIFIQKDKIITHVK
jgi:hypothetical protein